jgi:hypothetical protein
LRIPYVEVAHLCVRNTCWRAMQAGMMV